MEKIKGILLILSIFSLPIIASFIVETLTNFITIDMVVKALYLMSGLAISYLVKELDKL